MSTKEAQAVDKSSCSADKSPYPADKKAYPADKSSYPADKNAYPADKSSYPRGIKWTRQRKCVYEMLAAAKEPLSAQQIYNLAEQTAGEEINAISTVYRILTVFEEKGFVSKTSWTQDGTALYELNRGEHTHYAVCLDCHKRIPLLTCPFTHLHLEEEPGNFTVTGHKLELYGYCKACQKTHNSDENAN